MTVTIALPHHDWLRAVGAREQSETARRLAGRAGRASAAPQTNGVSDSREVFESEWNERSNGSEQLCYSGG
ncbi:hypothetical protein [Salinigranum sp. GCM10025319]|uniref:hypothetical protein n=1 Tax=Salinigranum sp. GCM10025319 TaxID=3252687 RepID=UPI00360B5355